MNFNDENGLEFAKKLNKHFEQNLQSTRQTMYDYYINNPKIKSDYKESEFSDNNETILTNYVQKLVNERVCYGTGKSITYKSDNDDLLECLTINNRVQDADLIPRIFEQLEIYGYVYIVPSIIGDTKDNQVLKYRVLDARNCVAYENIDGEVEMLLYRHTDFFDSKKYYIDVYASDGIFYCDKSLSLRPVDELAFEGITTNPVTNYIGNGFATAITGSLQQKEYSTVYNACKTIVDGLEKALSDFGNNLSDFRDSYMVGYDIDFTEEQIKMLEKLRFIGIKNSKMANGQLRELKFLERPVNAEYTKIYLELLDDLIYKATQHINSNEAMQSNTSGVAIQSKIINLRNLIQNHQACLEIVIRKMLKMLFIYLSKYNEIYDVYEIDIKQYINIPSDYSTIADVMSKVGDKVSDESIIDNFPDYFTNGKREVEKKLEEDKVKAKNNADCDNLIIGNNEDEQQEQQEQQEE